jgi:signal transduction histidine kinase
MNIKHLLFAALILFGINIVHAQVDNNNDEVYKALRDSMHESFNNADEDRFFKDIKKLENYLLEKNDLHRYYTQRCNEIVFMMNTQKIFEAYKAARQLSSELREKKLDKEMYMAYNMLGHIYRYCGNEEAAKRNFREVINMMEKSGYRESMPPIYMNIVGVVENDNPEEALKLIEEALAIAKESSPERVFDIETRRTLIYYNMGEKEKFQKGYEAYKKGEAKGLTSVHGRALEVYHEAFLGKTDEAVKMAREELGEDSYSTIAQIYVNAGRWEEAYKAQQEESKLNDSINNMILTNSVEGLRTELTVYDLEREKARTRTITLTIIILLLLMLVAAQIYIFWSRRRHMRELKVAYERALESDKMKTAFIQNISHEVRTPLNIISGFAQVVSDPEMTSEPEERHHIAKMMIHNTRVITNLIDEMLELSINETSGDVKLEDGININDLMSSLIQENEEHTKPDVKLVYDNLLPEGFTMTTNKDMVRRMVNVLIDNAIKNTDQGSITLRASINEGKLEIVVEDTGCGIPPEDTERIFERFVKLNEFKEGLGLGLPLCRMLANRLHGCLILDQSYSPGARFVLSLPI